MSFVFPALHTTTHLYWLIVVPLEDRLLSKKKWQTKKQFVQPILTFTVNLQHLLNKTRNLKECYKY